ncbi:hypothetical protein D8B26_006947 [Coccidioides posadasii str. Silveira]|uniref:Uncharacterized protein n=1 Tax=Coccidioides posadasii (strain RMSCC 757 / Silveira) TaxID=443226 RepID=E9DG67_COCPS|nr:hypothetical protein CPSG_08816 [Coccidioides posadasii str. Silveira]QVM12316.1 hypothetical protein D8B26_006947 [Coccidioides posadasii str. Silveira]
MRNPLVPKGHSAVETCLHCGIYALLGQGFHKYGNLSNCNRQHQWNPDIDNIDLARPSIIDAPEKAAKSSRILAARSFCARLAPTHLSVLSTLQMQKREGQVEMALTDRESNSSRSMRIPKGIMTLTMIRAEITSRKWPLHKSKQRQIRWFRHAVGRNCPGWYQKATTQKPHPTSTFNHAVKIKEYTPLGDDCGGETTYSIDFLSR